MNKTTLKFRLRKLLTWYQNQWSISYQDPSSWPQFFFAFHKGHMLVGFLLTSRPPGTTFVFFLSFIFLVTSSLFLFCFLIFILVNWSSLSLAIWYMGLTNARLPYCSSQSSNAKEPASPYSPFFQRQWAESRPTNLRHNRAQTILVSSDWVSWGQHVARLPQFPRQFPRQHLHLSLHLEPNKFLESKRQNLGLGSHQQRSSLETRVVFFGKDAGLLLGHGDRMTANTSSGDIKVWHGEDGGHDREDSNQPFVCSVVSNDWDCEAGNLRKYDLGSLTWICYGAPLLEGNRME